MKRRLVIIICVVIVFVVIGYCLNKWLETKTELDTLQIEYIKLEKIYATAMKEYDAMRIEHRKLEATHAATLTELEDFKSKCSDYEARCSTLIQEVRRLNRDPSTFQLKKTEFKFINNLKDGQTGDEVRYLQIFLKAQGPEIYPEGIVSGRFGPLTKAAVIRFQEKYSEDVLVPYGLSQGNGFVGRATREKMNELLSEQKINPHSPY